MTAIVATFEEENYEECIDSSLNRITKQCRHARDLGANEASREKQLIRDFNKAVLKAKETLGDDGLRIHNLSPLLQNLYDCRSKLIPLLTSAGSTPQESLEIALTRINVPLVFALFDLDLIDCFLALKSAKTGTHGTDTAVKDSQTTSKQGSVISADDHISGKVTVKTLSHNEKETFDAQLQHALKQLDFIVTKVVSPLRKAKEKVHQGTDGSQEEMKRVIAQLLLIIQKYMTLRGAEAESVLTFEVEVEVESMSGMSMSDLYPNIDLGKLADHYAEMSMAKQAADNRDRRVLTKEQCEEINR